MPGQLGWNSDYDGWLYSSDSEGGGIEHKEDCRDAAGGADEDDDNTFE